MEERSELFSFDQASKLLKKNLLVVGLVFGGILLLITGLFQFITTGSAEDNGEIEFITEEESKGKIMVDVAGAVKNPGVYELKNGDRINDAIDAAGGLNDANEEYLSQNMNFAEKLTDGMKIYIPNENEESGGVLGGVASDASGLINLNSASKSRLEELPKVGPVTADKIIAGRPYDSVDDLLIKKVVGASTFDKIKDLVSAP